MTVIIQDIVSVFFVLILGYVSGKRGMFDQNAASALNKLVLTYCLPALLFISIAANSREELLKDSNLLLASVIVLISWYFIAFLVAMFAFHHDKREAGIAGLSAGAPTVGFLGMAVLLPIFGPPAALVVAIVSLVVNVLQIPLGMFFVAPPGTKPTAALSHALSEPVVFAPILGVVFVLAGWQLPELMKAPLALIGHANSGVAVFAVGLVLSAHKMQFNFEIGWNVLVKIVLMPATMLVVAVLLGVRGEHLEQLLLLAALPPAFTGVVIAGRYQTYFSQASSSVIISVIVFAVAAPAWIAIARSIGPLLHQYGL